MTPKQAKDLAMLALAACPSAASFLDADSMLAMFTIWADLLEDIDHAEGRAALKRYLALPANAGKLPSPGHLRGIVAEAVGGRRRPGGDAWGDVMALFRPTRSRAGRSSHEPPRESDLADPLAWRALTAIGWPVLCAMDVDDPAPRSQFVRLYDALAAGAAEDRSVATLPGVARPALPASSSPAMALVGDVVKRLTDGAR